MRSQSIVQVIADGVVVLALLAFTVVSTPLARAQDKLPKEQVVFDAQTQMFTDSPRYLSAGKSLAIIVENVNTFREKYTVKLQGQDFHGAAVPSALGNLFIGAKTAPFAGPVGLRIASAPGAKTLKEQDEALYKLYETYIEALGAFETSVKNAPASQVSVDAIRDAVRVNWTNYLIRKEAIELLVKPLGSESHATYIRNLAADDTDDPQKWNAAATIEAKRKVVELYSVEAVQKAHENLTTAQQNWQKAADTKLAALAEGAPLRTAITEASEEITTTLRAATGTRDQVAEQNRILQNIFIIFTNPRAVPARITKVVNSVTGDMADVVIQVDQSPSGIVLVDPSDAKKALNTLVADATASSKSYTKSLPVYWRWVFDFSAGLAKTNLRLKNYYRDAGGVVQEGPGDRENTGATVLGQFYITTPLNISAGPTLGVMVGDAATARFLLGGSLVVGRRLRASLSAGRAYGKVNRLSSGDEVGKQTAGTAISTVSVVEQGSFQALTLTYSF